MKSESPIHQERSPNEQIKSIFPGINLGMLYNVVRVGKRKDHPLEFTYRARLNPPVDQLRADISIFYNFPKRSLVRSIKFMECGPKIPFGTILLTNPADSTSGLQPLSAEPMIQFHHKGSGLIYRINNGIFQQRYVGETVFQPAKNQLTCIESIRRNFSLYMNSEGIEVAKNNFPFLNIPAAPTVNSERFFV